MAGLPRSSSAAMSRSGASVWLCSRPCIGPVCAGRACTTAEREAPCPDEDLGGPPLPSRRHLRRRRLHLRPLLGGGDAGRVVPLRPRGKGSPRRPSRGDRLFLARLPARRAAGAALRLPRAWAMGSGEGPALQPEEAAARPLREGGGG